MTNTLTMLRDRARLMRKTDDLKALEHKLSVSVSALEYEYYVKRQELINQFYKDVEELTLTKTENN